MSQPRVVLAACSSGSGKTLITSGMLKAFLNRGLRLAAFKCGPDYIDPKFHRQVLKIPSGNLDTYFTDPDTTRYLFQEGGAGAELCIIEGVMGFYDGIGGNSERASTYELAQVLEAPVILIVNCRGASGSLAAMIKGFLEYRQPSMIKGVILNQISPMLYGRIKALIEAELELKVYGYLPYMEELAIPSRHLGLVLPEEIPEISEKLEHLAARMEETVDLEGILNLASQAARITARKPKLPAAGRPVQIGVAYDEAFCFYYQENFKLLRELGAKLSFFSPLQDEGLPAQADGLIFGGGYPENYCQALSNNTKMRAAVQAAVNKGMPCLAECGGFLYLHQKLRDREGTGWPMAGVIPGEAYYQGRSSHFGYVELENKKDQLTGRAGTKIRGHEFHYFKSEVPGADVKAQKPLSSRSWQGVHGSKSLYAGFPHLYFYSNSQVPHAFLETIRRTR